jgi:thiol-disulfide isomerase/thioredoxin
MDRGVFMRYIILTMAGLTVPPNRAFAMPSPSPTTTPFPWDECDVNDALPYDRPLEFKMRTLDGPDFDLASYRGKALLLNIFATWCGPCYKEMPFVVEAASTYAARGFAVVGIDSEESDNAVRAFRKRFNITFPIAMDANGGFTRALEVGKSRADVLFPTSLFIDPGGYLWCMQQGGMGSDELNYRVERFLGASFSSPSPHAAGW